MGQVRKLFNAVKRLVKGIIKPCLKQKLEAPQYEYVVQELVHVQTTTYTADECPAYSEVDLIRQRQQAQYEIHQRHHRQHLQQYHQSESMIQATNTPRTDDLDGYCAVYEDPGPPDGYIITESGCRIPCWWNPPQDLPPPMNQGSSYQ